MGDKWNNPNIAVLMTSRNNYDYMEFEWVKKTLEECDIGNMRILNIDEDSKEIEKEKGRKLCKKYKNMIYMDREDPGMHHNIDTAIRFFGDDIKYIIWFQHDCWPLQKDFFYNFNKLVANNKLSQFGLVGFNGIAQNIFKHGSQLEDILKEFRDGKKPLGVLSRCHLESVATGDFYYCGYKVEGRIDKPVSKNMFCKPFSCSQVNFFAQAVNVELYKKYIDINRPFYFFKSWDDISLQFLYHNVYNLVLPGLYVEHRPDTKRKYDLPYLSNKPVDKGDSTFHNESGWKPQAWIDIWGWHHSHPEQFENVKDRYKGTLLYEFYKYDYVKNGPLKIFEEII